MASLHLLLISGSLRARSINAAVLRTVTDLVGPGVTAERFEGTAALPAFNPDLDVEPLPPAVADLRHRLHRADAVLVSTPEYAGALPGAFKNLLDWTIGDDQPGSIYEKPVAWINPSAWGAAEAHRSLRLVLGYAHATVVESACRDLPVPSSQIGADGLIADPDVRAELSRALRALVAAVAPGPDA